MIEDLQADKEELKTLLEDYEKEVTEKKASLAQVEEHVEQLKEIHENNLVEKEERIETIQKEHNMYIE